MEGHWIEDSGLAIFVDGGKLACLWLSDFMVWPNSADKPIENLLFVVHIILWFTCTHEIHENWYPTYNNESKVFLSGESFRLLVLRSHYNYRY